MLKKIVVFFKTVYKIEMLKNNYYFKFIFILKI